MKVIGWVKRNWQLVLVVVLALFLWRKNTPIVPSPVVSDLSYSTGYAGKEASIGGANFLPRQVAPAPEVSERMVVETSTLSLLVGEVKSVVEVLTKKARELGGYMVESNLSSPEGVTSGWLTVRVPTENLDQFLGEARGISVRVVSENLSGEDVTDEYVDIGARLETLNKTRIKFEEILNQASRVADILEVQRELVSLQQQIDALKGSEKYLEKSAETARVTLYLSTDELALPYAPSEAWRPKAIFKQATRALLGFARNLGSLAIWVVVFSVIWVPALLVVHFVRKRLGGKK